MEMDYSVLYGILIVVGVVGVIFITRILKQKGMVDETELQMAAQVLGLSVAVLQELRIKNEPQITAIANICLIAVDTAIETTKTTDINVLLIKAKDNAYKACALYGLELNTNRKMILDTLLEIGLKAKF